MASLDEMRASGLSERSSFALLHCDRPMAYLGSRSTWQGTFPEGASTLENQYRCDGCGAALDLKLVEPDQQPPASTP